LHEEESDHSTNKGQQKTNQIQVLLHRFQIDLIDFHKLRKRDIFGVLMHWVMTIKDHMTYKLQEIFGIIGYPKIFHTENGTEFTAKVVLKELREMNPHTTLLPAAPVAHLIKVLLRA